MPMFHSALSPAASGQARIPAALAALGRVVGGVLPEGSLHSAELRGQRCAAHWVVAALHLFFVCGNNDAKPILHWPKPLRIPLCTWSLWLRAGRFDSTGRPCRRWWFRKVSFQTEGIKKNAPWKKENLSCDLLLLLAQLLPLLDLLEQTH